MKKTPLTILKNRAFTLLFVISTMLLSVSTATAQDASPKQVVETMVNSVLIVLRDNSLSISEKTKEIETEVFKAFDSRAMAQSVLSSNWRQASSSQQDQFEELFLQTLENTYVNRLESFTNETVEFLSEDIKDKRATVESLVIRSGADVPVDYKLRQRSDGWFVYDVVVENVSMVSSYRETYRSIVRRSGLDSLLEQMKKNVEEFEI